MSDDVMTFEEYREILNKPEDELEEMFPDGCWIIYYPTKQHEESGKKWFIPAVELKFMAQWSKARGKKKLELLWKK